MIIEQYEPTIYHIMNSLSIYKDRDEYYQIGLIALWEAWKKFDSEKGSSFLSFAYTNIKGRILIELAKARKRDERNSYPKEEFWELQIDDPEDPLEFATLLTYCDGLTATQKKWVILTFYYGLTMNEIAIKENVSYSAVKKWRNKAMKELKRKIK
ncbi:sigma-70 family RNA polymerase sigma factor [Heyndrickxia vini]|uniref:Sigma-70 family RNA polymerase sigma factor n=1 Tax=Heyndrickxia vini TaxID=1476025 RepID=A0ABX7E417_9BACI|nr:sigma-70 family RNA polymerase sigma factor [Heyndrickxia vini]QQZ10040.1 sigma-70 family RNA polymerase sigma factor [Heyndrickxia vini]